MRHLSVDPQGTVRQAFRQLRSPPEAEGLERLRSVLGDAHFAAARELALWVDDGRTAAAVLVLAAACLESARRGSSRLPVGLPEAGPLRELLDALEVPPERRGHVFELLERTAAGMGPTPVVGRWTERSPLVTDGHHVALQRLAALEAAVGAQLRSRLEAPPPTLDAARLERAMADVLARPPHLGAGRGSLVPSEEQRRAALAAVSRPLTVVSGGPGTGKTSVVVTFLRLWVRLGRSLDEVALAAPTGKAARRLDEAIGAALGALEAPAPAELALAATPPSARTLHRLLGYSPATGHFAHHARNRLPHGLVVVDEGSMVDLALMHQLLAAVDDGAHLVLLGDAEQLPSVDAGAVLRDLLPPEDAESPGSTAPAPDDGPVDLRRRAAVRLTKSHRMDEGSPEGRALALASQAIRRGLRPEAREVSEPQALRFQGLEWLRDDDGGTGEADAARSLALREAFLERWFRAQVLPPEGALARLARRTYRLRGGRFEPGDEAHLDELDRAAQRARLLCLTRTAGEPSGTAFVNAWMAERLALELEGRGPAPGAGGSPTGPRRRDGLQTGLPVLVSRNAYELELFNGDQGLALWVRREGAPEPRLALVFRERGGFRAIEPSALSGAFEACFAMTVHKSQGSEHEAVALLLPAAPTPGEGARGDAAPLLCRELVYTALTRARRSAVVVASAAAVDLAVARRLERWSALGDAQRWCASGSPGRASVSASPGTPPPRPAGG